MKIFIENEAESDRKNIFYEKTLEYKKTVTVSRKYPYPYGFILDTTSGDGDNLDVFVITNEKLKSGQIVEGDPIGLMEQREITKNSSVGDIEEADHNILATLSGEQAEVDDEVKNRLSDFVSHVFDHLPNKKNQVGNFLGRDEAIRYMEECKDK